MKTVFPKGGTILAALNERPGEQARNLNFSENPSLDTGKKCCVQYYTVTVHWDQST